VLGVDATDHGAVVAALRGYDLAASALGPFHRFELPLARAAIEAGVDYASVCDEWQAAEAVLDQLAAPARAAGVRVVTGLGASPGITSIGIRYVAGKLDRVRRADISVYQPLDAGGGEAVLRHMLFIMSGDVAIWRGGKRVEIPACSEHRVVEFPRFGGIDVWNMGHAEPVTLPRYFPGIEEVTFFMGFGRGSALFIQPARLGVFSRPRVVDLTVRGALAVARLAGRRAPSPGAVRIDVWGDRQGGEVHRMGCGVGGMRATTGLALSVGAQMLARREILTRGGGVYAPEACLEPELFLAGLRARGIEAFEDLAMTRPIGVTPPRAGAGVAAAVAAR
jgi:saccharopine dehydrogenase-like NADP-dependent oxidoreductase